MGMTFEEKGAYLELLLFQFNNGRFSKAQAKLVLSICSASVFDKVLQKFDTDGKVFWKQRLADEIERRKKFSESRRNNAKGPKKQDSSSKTEKAYAEHMETINENEYVLIGEEKISNVEREMEYYEAALNGRVNEHKLPPWRILLPVWLKQSNQLVFNDSRHVFNTFSKFMIDNAATLSAKYKPTETSKKFEEAEYNKTLWTQQGWEDYYGWRLKSDNEFRKHFGYEELPGRKTMGGHNNGRASPKGDSGPKG
jgi:uncharacterized protein YdaU (DUF1376 family)